MIGEREVFSFVLVRVKFQSLQGMDKMKREVGKIK